MKIHQLTHATMIDVEQTAMAFPDSYVRLKLLCKAKKTLVEIMGLGVRIA